ncbi:MAG: fatty acid desaturase family protein [Myxococcota bacterium]
MTPTRATDVLTRDEIQSLTARSDARGALAVATTLGIIAGSMALVAISPSVWAVLLAMILIGGRHLGLAILLHECAHRSLFKTPWLNDMVGTWICGAPTGNRLSRYRKHHIKHHRHTGSEDDPDLGLVRPFPTTRRSMARKIRRDLIGVTGVKRIIAILMMDLGYLRYTASVDPERIDQTDRTPRDRLRDFVKHTGPTLLTNGMLLGILTVLGHPLLYLLWVGAYLTTYSLFLRLRSIAEHACMPDPTDPFRGTRTTRANLLARLTVAPHHVNYHLEHHLLMTVPHYHLPRMHRLLQERGALPAVSVAPHYRAVLRQVTAG